MKRDLWLRLRRYQFDNLVPPHLWDHVAAAFGNTDASTRAFANKIARKHGWHPRFARRAIDEYRKFVFLGVTADFVVTPPKIIDQVWHEHLLFSRAYREFCRDVLQRDFDHHPELIPSDEQVEIYEAQYHATLALYEYEFRVAPPPGFWGTPKFARDPNRKPTARKKEPTHTNDGGDSGPLYACFDGRGDNPSHHEMAEFGGSGAFAGGGGGEDWSSPTSQSDSGGESGGDSGGSDGGSDGGSSCSSGCGGGGD